MPLWQIDIHPAPGQPDRDSHRIAEEIHELGLADALNLRFARGFLVQGDLDRAEADALAGSLLADAVTERAVVAPVGDPALSRHPEGNGSAGGTVVHVMPKPGVMDPVANSSESAARDAGFSVASVRTLRKYWLPELESERLEAICRRALSNDSVEQVVVGPLHLDHLGAGTPYDFQRVIIPIRQCDDAALERMSRERQLYLTLVEMQTIRQYFTDLGRDPSDIELESVAQTWSEHCSHKTLAGRIDYRGPGADGEPEADRRHYDNMLKETIFAATQEIRRRLGDDDWCVSVFSDNAGVVRFDDEFNVCFKVETHNHPSALEPYGGANTGIGGVIRDPLGTGLGAKPVCNTDVFCFAPPDTPADSLPPGVLHPRRVIKGVVAGVRDYGNRMGIPTVNGAVYFDRRYLGNPLVYCGNVGIMPRDKCFGAAQAGDAIVALGGRTGRDGIHGATFSSAELTSESESLSGGAVQIGNAIQEKMVLDVLLQARDEDLYSAVTDCGAGGFSSAVGEMGEKIGAEVWLERCPLKYEGLSYTEIWISEAQERMVLSVPPEKWERLRQLCEGEGVEVTQIGRFVPTGRLQLTYHGETVGDIAMEFLHDGRPPVIREAVYHPAPLEPLTPPQLSREEAGETLRKILGSLNVASKHWVIRQYDHEVQGGSAIKPLVGPECDGPGDAAVVRPRRDSHRGLVISNGMNPHYGDFDTYHMAASAIDEAMRNAVAVGADPSRIAILDNFCWGYTDRAETLGSLVRAAIACQDQALALGTPFISGKDSLNNEFSYTDADGQKQTIAIPPSLLISAMGQVDDVRQCVTMDAKAVGNRIYLVGATRDELGGSHFSLVRELCGGQVPRVDLQVSRPTFAAVHQAIMQGTVRACHDLSEGGLAVAAAEMAFAGGLGLELDLSRVVSEQLADTAAPETIALFSESNSRFLVEVPEAKAAAFESLLAEVPCVQLGTVIEEPVLRIRSGGEERIVEPLAELKDVWQRPLDW
ncbi:phosphoribosylformylglycinamidine synthase subunit PurL [Candidatus Laterigemmans baculatus]|uniref:phosphoribosylformylglycinamidine synthase subunit PurL n=1 Tax=Candidatus Laterigemmans baculatus TaxID=2770505 RepID=UPI0013DC1FC8|nr:phosphoribosylformylglycinamidine synthase subunit PurL [Candidatus Laterigemmans baculatus]